MSVRPTSARDLALAALRDRAGNVTAHLNRLLATSAPPAEEAALARELALGVVRRRRTLDAVLSAFERGGRGRTAGKIRQITRLGAYQLLFLDRVPAFAAVNEAVAQVGTRSKARGFVNAILRSVSRSLSPPQSGPPPLEADVVAVGADRFRRLDRGVFPDPRQDAAGFLAEAYSLPDELARRWLAGFGGLAEAARVATHANARAPLIMRVNARRATVGQVLERLASAGVEAVAHANALSVVVPGGADVTSLEVFTAGLVQPQDAAATDVVASAAAEPGMRVLDLCAAPGTKTTHLAERMDDRGSIVAADVSGDKLARIEAGCRRMGVTIVRTVLAERLAEAADEPFDLVLVDAPCSNTGVLSRRPEARWRISPKRLRSLARDQRRLLTLAAELVRPGGRVVYATCSLEAEENGQVVRDVLARRKRLGLIEERTGLPAGADDPARWRDGGYWAALTRRR